MEQIDDMLPVKTTKCVKEGMPVTSKGITLLAQQKSVAIVCLQPSPAPIGIDRDKAYSKNMCRSIKNCMMQSIDGERKQI